MPLGALTAPFAATLMPPPVGTNILLFLPAFNTIAPLYPVRESMLELLEMGSLRSMSPFKVSINTGPAA